MVTYTQVLVHNIVFTTDIKIGLEARSLKTENEEFHFEELPLESVVKSI